MTAANVDREARVAQVSREIGWEACMAAIDDAGRRTARVAARTTWTHPQHAEVAATWTPDWRPCPRRCGRCSRCVASLAYWQRGGRPFLGVEAERELAAS